MTEKVDKGIWYKIETAPDQKRVIVKLQNDGKTVEVWAYKRKSVWTLDSLDLNGEHTDRISVPLGWRYEH